MTESAAPVSPPRGHRLRRGFAWCVVVVAILGVAATTWIWIRGALAVGHLSEARATLEAAAADLGDASAAASALDVAATDTSAARALTDDPIWTAASQLPWVGPQLRTVGLIASTTDEVVSEGLAPLARTAASLSTNALRPTEGTFDVTLLSSAEPAAAAASAHLRTSAAQLSSTDTRAVLGPLRGALGELSELVTSAADSADALHRATQLVPEMLGAAGPRSYLVLFQNNAEWRSLGGIVGAMAQIDARAGNISLVDQASSSDFPGDGRDQAVDLPPEVEQIFDTRPARYIQNVTQVPDFSVDAPIAREMWHRQRGRTVDGVVALDPVTLGYLLRATGPVVLPTGEEVTSGNAVPLLLDEVYRRYPDPARQDEFFRLVSASVFDALADGRADPRLLIDALRQAGAERRLLVWNADPAEQAILDGTTLQGGLPVTDDERTTFGVYLNDGTGSKMDLYLRPEVTTTWCGSDSAEVRVTLRNDAPDPSTLPDYVTGAGAYGVPVGHVRTGVYVYLPAGARLVGQRSLTDGEPAGFAGGTHDGRQVVKWSVELAPGEQAHLDLRVATPLTPELGVVMTPTIDPAVVARQDAGCTVDP